MLALQPITLEIAEQLNLAQESGAQDQFFLQRIKRDIEKVRAVNISEYYMLLGVYYSVTLNYEKCVENYETSLRLGAHSRVLRNYAFSLKNFGKGQKALALVLRAFELEPTLGVLEEVLIAAFQAGCVDGIDEVIAKFSRANPNIDLSDRQDIYTISWIHKLLSYASVSSADLKDVMAIADDILASHRFQNYKLRYEGEAFGDVPYISVELVVDTYAADKILTMNQEIADRVAASDISNWDKVIVRFSPESESTAL